MAVDVEGAQRELHWREYHRRLARDHPAFLLDFVSCVDSKTGDRFRFQLLTEDERRQILGPPGSGLYDRFGLTPEPGGWHWQRDLLEEWRAYDRWIGLKARQIGITWLAGGFCLHSLIFLPGTRCLVISTNEDEAKKLISRIWGMWNSVPSHLKVGMEVTVPRRESSDPTQEIEVKHPDGRRSAILALPSTKKAGHGETANKVILDEGAYQDYLRDTWKGTFPTIDDGGQIIVISTGNGVSNEATGEGNFFHYLWQNGDSMGLKKRFLRWDLHPRRDEAWYSKNAAALPPIERAQQYPRDPEDAFLSTQPCAFNLDSLGYYGHEAVTPELYRMTFKRDPYNIHKMIGDRAEFGEVRVFEEPVPKRKYAMAGDVATGKGTDFSAAYVIDLTTMNWVAEYHSKVSPAQFAEVLWAMGRWYNDATLAVEMGGGYGDAVLVSLRDGVTGLTPYKHLYRHLSETRLKKKRQDTFGYPITNKTRPKIIGNLEDAIRTREMESMPGGLIGECRTFVNRAEMPSPRAADGANDDRVMSAGLALEMYRRYGHHEHGLKRAGTALPATPGWTGI